MAAPAAAPVRPERVEGPARGPGSAHQPARHQAAEHGDGRRTPSDASLLWGLHERRLPEINTPPVPASHFRSAAPGAGKGERTTTPVVQRAAAQERDGGCGAGADGRCSSRLDPVKTGQSGQEQIKSALKIKTERKRKS